MRVGGRRSARARITDRIEDVVAWLFAVLAVVLVGLAVIVGQHAHDRTLIQDNPRNRQVVDAVVLDTLASDQGPAMTVVRWMSPSGRAVIARIPPIPRATGAHVPVWVDRQTGALAHAPADPAVASVVGWTWGAAVALAGWALLVLAWFGVRTVTARHNARVWEREWARVERLWSGRREQT